MKKHRYTKEQIDYMRKIAKGRTAGEINAMVNEKFGLSVTLKSTKGIMYRQGIKNHMQGCYTRFEKGHESWNKGKRVFIKGSEKGHFKKGHTQNRKPVGSESMGKGYVMIKIAEPNVWVKKHRYIWEQAYGEIPEGKVILFKDSNRENVVLDNLFMTDRPVSSAVARRKMKKDDPDLNLASHRVVELGLTIKKKKESVSNG